MNGQWWELAVILPSHLTKAEVTEAVRATVLVAAADGGDLVRSVRIVGCQQHSEGWLRWQAAYLPGLPTDSGFPVSRLDEPEQ